MQVGVLEAPQPSRALTGAAGELLGRQSGPIRQPVPAWLPVPATPRLGPALQRQPGRTATTSRSVWITTTSETRSEKLAMGLIVLSAAIGIGYGLWCLLDLVQNWAVFHAGVGVLLQ